MKTKLIALDLDGTVLNSEGVISDITVSTIKRAIENGIHIVLATGRSVGLICEEIKCIKGIKYAITSNGAAIVDLKENKIIYSNFLSIDILKKIIKIIRDFPIIVEFYANGYAYIDEEVFFNPIKYGLNKESLGLMYNNHKLVKDIFLLIEEEQENEFLCFVEKINIPFLKGDMREDLFKRLSSMNNDIKITSSVKDNLEINSYNANKGNGLEELSRFINISLEETAAIGDNNNDIEMIQKAGIGIAMGNAIEDIKIKADFITLNNDNDGVAEMISKILDGNL